MNDRFVVRWPNGNLKCTRRFDDNGKLHCDDGPAVIFYREDGKLSSEVWLKHDNYHNLKGPTVINYDEKGKVVSEHYYIDGEHFKCKLDWEQKVAELNRITDVVKSPQLSIEVKVNGNIAELTDEQYSKICLILSNR